VAANVAAVWRCRYFWFSLVRMDLANRYRRSALGLGWSLLQPLVLTLIVYTVFREVLTLNVKSYALLVLTGLVVWNYVTSVTTQGCQCFLIAEAYLRQCPSPLAIFPLRTALGGLVHFLLALAVVVVAAGMTVGLPGPLAAASLIPGVALIFTLAWALALLAGVANVVFRDTEHLVLVVFQGLFYVTPVIYPAEMLAQYNLHWLLRLNPLVAFLELLRAPLLEGQVAAWPAFAVAAGTVLVLSAAALAVLKHYQKRLIFYL